MFYQGPHLDPDWDRKLGGWQMGYDGGVSILGVEVSLFPGTTVLL